MRYNGSAQVAQGLATRSVDFTIDGTSASMPLVQAGQFRALAKFDSRPFPAMPEIPVIQVELPNYEEISVWLALVAPTGTPPAAAGLFPATSTPAELAAFIRKEAARWQDVVKETGIRYD